MRGACTRVVTDVYRQLADRESPEDLRTDADRDAAIFEGLNENALYRYATTQEDSLQHSRPQRSSDDCYFKRIQCECTHLLQYC